MIGVLAGIVHAPAACCWRSAAFALTILIPLSGKAANVDVFIGGTAPDLGRLADPAVAAPLIATGRIGLYEHGTGMAHLFYGDHERWMALFRTWRQTGVLDHRGQGEVAPIAEDNDGSPYANLLSPAGFPVEVNINTGFPYDSTWVAPAGAAHPGRVYHYYPTEADGVATTATCRGNARYGARNSAIVQNAIGQAIDTDDRFAVSPFWRYFRSAALYCGGLFIDIPPAHWFRSETERTRNFNAQEIVWARRNGLRATLLVSPYVGGWRDAAGNAEQCGYDSDFRAETLRLLADLQARHAMPTQVVVESYCGDAGKANTSNQINPADPQGLFQVALAVATQVRLAPPGRTPGQFPGAIAQIGAQAWQDPMAAATAAGK